METEVSKWKIVVWMMLAVIIVAFIVLIVYKSISGLKNQNKPVQAAVIIST